jgi:hypothetical protein
MLEEEQRGEAGLAIEAHLPGATFLKPPPEAAVIHSDFASEDFPGSELIFLEPPPTGGSPMIQHVFI